MASDGPGKYRERKSRTTKPYDRPKGIIRRVTDSVTGLFSASWLSGWIGGEEEEEESGNQQQPGSLHTATLPPPGESFIFAQPVITTRRPFKPFYPEEGVTESSGQHQHVNEGASTSRMSAPGAAVAAGTPLGMATAPSRPLQLGGGDLSSPVVSGRRLPVLSSTPTSMFTGRSKSHLEPRPLPIITTSTPTGDDGSSEVSESSGDTGVDASVIPRPDERDYQREILQLDEESLQTLRDSLAKTVPGPVTSPIQPPAAAVLPTLEETRKRPRDLEPDHSSIRAESSVSSKSLFSEVGDLCHGQPQPSGLASKRPRFNVSMYGSPLLDDKSVLSDSAFKASPFYPGKTMYGGASAYRRSRLQPRTPQQTTRAQVKAKAATESNDGGLSQAARRILESLEQMSTPISDAKRIPTPTPGQRGSFLDHLPGSYRAAAFHRQRPLRKSLPPTSALLTPIKVPVQANLATNLLSSGQLAVISATSSRVQKKDTSTISSDKAEDDATSTNTTQQSLDVRETEQENKSKVDVHVETPAISIFSKAAAEATVKFAVPTQPAALQPPPPPIQVFKFGLTNDTSASQSAFQFVPKPATTTSTSDAALPSKKFIGKVKSKVVESGRSYLRHEEEVVEEQQLPAISLNMASLPKINLSIASPVQSSPFKYSSSSPERFKFSIPEIVDTQSVCESFPNIPQFTFRSPALVGEAASEGSGAPAVMTQMMFNSSSPSFAPKLKTNVKKGASTPDKLMEGSILDFLNSKGSSPEKLSSLLNNHEDSLKLRRKPFSTASNLGSQKSMSEHQPVNSVVKETGSSQGFQGFSSTFKKSSNEWDCSECMIRNKNSVTKCVACEAPKSEHSLSSTNAVDSKIGDEASASLLVSVAGWGDTFKMSSSEWECDTCMVRNKNSSDKCISCETPRPGSQKAESGVVVSLTVSNKNEKSEIGFGTVFAKVKGEWECDTCLVRNKGDVTKCISCETPKPGAANVCEAITGNFKFGANTNNSTGSSPFKFGVSNSQTEEVKAKSEFSFVGSAKIVEEDKKGDSGFKFGVPTKKSDTLTGFGFSSVPVKDESEGSSAGFTFGVQTIDSKSKEKTDKKISSILSSNKITESSGIGTADTTAMFQFTPQNKTKVAFSFGSCSQEKTATPEKPSKAISNVVCPAVKLESERVVDALKKGNESKVGELTFESKMDNAEIKNQLFGMNSIVPGVNKDNEKKFSTPSIFSVSKVADTAIDVASPPTFSANSNTELKSTPTGSSFSFGDKGSTGNAFPSFSFTATTVNNEETISNFNFKPNSKRNSSDAGEPAKKMAFGLSTTTSGTNNVVPSSPSSLFTFGSKENKLGTGGGFGTPHATTPAFGAPAPSSNPTSSFQFGNSNPPAPAATAPSPAFGNPAPAFGAAASAFGNNNNNNSSSSGFAFGQSTEKKSSAGFDFGQATTNSTPGSQGFNFAAATQPSTGLFQFGQTQVNSSSSTNIFKFGTANTEVPPPATAFGSGENPFSSAPPSGRVVKKAIRRNRK